MVHNTLLGLRQVPAEIRESGEMSGCTYRQLFWLVEIPTAMKQILVGINQTVMAVFAMVIIAAVIGGSDDIGWEVLQTMRRADFGRSLLSGMVITLLAILIDRMTLRLAEGPGQGATGAAARYRRLLAPFGALLVVAVAAALLPILQTFPAGWRFYPANALNDALLAFVGRFGDTMTWIKDTAIYFVFLPLRIGLRQAVSPFSWGFALTPAMIQAYWLSVALLTLGALLLGRNRTAIGVALFGWLLYYGTMGVAWPGFFAVILLLAYRAGGLGVAAFALLSMLFVAVSGGWEHMMQSLYLCALAVAICFVGGGALGVWAAHSDRVSAILRPIQDTLQTIPQFVLLIPALMLFQVGEFTALLAIILYAIVPPIRYVEHGLRSVPAELIEASTQMGCSPRQILFNVKLPVALGSIMLGLNQTILFALSMLAIAALVGTQGLALDVYLALAKADAGLGLVAGLSIALVALVTDRIIRAWSRRYGEIYGT
jgi:glycine betaine/proline transport system permease protein